MTTIGEQLEIPITALAMHGSPESAVMVDPKFRCYESFFEFLCRSSEIFLVDRLSTMFAFAPF
jgi:hypothetical protein